MPIDHYGAEGWAKYSRHASQRSGLSRAVRAEKSNNLARLEKKIKIVHGAEFLIFLAEMNRFQHRCSFLPSFDALWYDLRGTMRVAEVAARFTLDAMPGKQMSIDADLNAGVINETEARTRRKQIETEADFYGAMDGASKFVKGDAIASILIIIVNIVGGFAVGFMKG